MAHCSVRRNSSDYCWNATEHSFDAPSNECNESRAWQRPLNDRSRQTRANKRDVRGTILSINLKAWKEKTEEAKSIQLPFYKKKVRKDLHYKIKSFNFNHLILSIIFVWKWCTVKYEIRLILHTQINIEKIKRYKLTNLFKLFLWKQNSVNF